MMAESPDMSTSDENAPLGHPIDDSILDEVPPLGVDVNVGPFERGASITLGGALLALALSRRRSPGDMVLGALGAYLALRGATGHCVLYDALDTGTATDEEDERLGAGGHDDASVEAVLTITRPPEEVYAFWRNPENAPLFMKGIETVTALDDTRSRWLARGPDGDALEWEAEILEDRPGELIAWRSRPGALVHHAGAVRFRPAPGARGTEVRLDVEFEPPGAPLVRALSQLFGAAFEYVVDEDLRRLKQLLEAGETATTRGQPQGLART
jgi:uncharacterized membrane protein